MAIKISGTEVIDINRNLQNIAGANGTYGNFHPSAASIGTALNFSTPMMTKILSANTTFTESNKAAGKSAMLLLDTSSNFYTPTFSSDIKWEGGTTPTWSGYRYWQIALQCVDSTTARGVAKGYESTGGGSPSETISLSGTSGTPNFYFSSNTPIFTNNPPTGYDLTMGFEFKANGILYTYELTNGPPAGLASVQPYITGEWCNVTPTTTYYIRATTVAHTGRPPNYGDSLNTWLALSSDRGWYHQSTTVYGAYGYEEYTLKVEIASDSGGSNILDTGYYTFAWEGGA